MTDSPLWRAPPNLSKVCTKSLFVSVVTNGFDAVGGANPIGDAAITQYGLLGTFFLFPPSLVENSYTSY